MSRSRSDVERSSDEEQSSDDERFRALFAADFDDVWRFARRRCASSSDADDIAAQVFAVAWRRRDDAPTDDIRLWLFGVARNLLANHHRSGDRARRLERRLAGERPARPLATVGDVESDDRGEPLRAAIAELNEQDREVIVMRYWDELAVTEIASLLGLTPNAVSMRLHKSRQRLAAAVGRKAPTPDRQVGVDPRRGNEDDDGLA